MATFNNTGVTNDSHIYRCILKEQFKYILLPVSYTLVFVFGLALNITAMYFILFRTKHWKPSTIYMLNLNICDTLYVLTLPFLIYYYADKNDWPFGELMCKLIRFLFYTNLYGSILFLSCISLHRFLGICHPMRSLYWMNGRRARLVSVGVWMIILILQAPILYFCRVRLNNNDLVCHDTTIQELYNDFLVYSSVVMFLLFVVPFGVVLVCNGLMVKKLLDPGVLREPMSQRSKQKSVKMIIIVLLAFMLCFLPFHVNRSIYYTFRYLDTHDCDVLRLSNNIYKVTRPLVGLNSCIDPILYFMAGQSFRNSIKKKLSIKSDKSLSTLQ
ncbi:P2Y purinoceptor 2-like [Puntigrus tetrazona]|uniref:P2Y purinoceptor 2-like n=1 Tax=Puntigrus tetrazona TaxID=1606681 RepID=UPI001C89790A|nr:P2Y purinoceptor 2-like [Puntigrus tetrazona]XP_043072664.1 P2Y purinoceptor 2-like [Puntigrus tetrazona]XP_043072665.1 P2Y purinoceptor 2-like [Puntigrus tetrazona]